MKQIVRVLASACIMLAILLTMNNISVAADKTIELKFSDMMPADAESVQGSLIPWFKKIEEVTNGRVKITRYPMQTLVKASECWEAIKTGAIDMGWVVHGYLPGMTPLSEVIALPGLPIGNAEEAATICWTLFHKFPEIQEEFKDVKVLAFCNSGPYILNTTKKWIKTVEDLKGMKIRVLAGPGVDSMKALGAIPIMMNFGDIYVALERGVLDGVGTPWEAIYHYKHFEIAPYVTDVPLTCTLHSIPINKQKWNSLPPDIQNAIEKISGLETTQFLARKYWDATGKSYIIEQTRKAGKEVKIYTPPEAELKKFEAIGGKPIWEQWVEKMESKGYTSARKILDETVRLAQEIEIIN